MELDIILSRYRVKNMKNGKVSWVQASGQVQFKDGKAQKDDWDDSEHY